MDKIAVLVPAGVIFLLILCTCCYLIGYKKETQDIVKFHNSVWKTAEGGVMKEREQNE